MERGNKKITIAFTTFQRSPFFPIWCIDQFWNANKTQLLPFSGLPWQKAKTVPPPRPFWKEIFRPTWACLPHFCWVCPRPCFQPTQISEVWHQKIPICDSMLTRNIYRIDAPCQRPFRSLQNSVRPRRSVTNLHLSTWSAICTTSTILPLHLSQRKEAAALTDCWVAPV